MKYMAGRRKEAADLLSVILPHRTGGKDQWFIEPFGGGCELSQRITGNRMCNDINGHLLDVYRAMQKGWNPADVEWTRELYEHIRDHQEQYTAQEVGFAGIFCSYRGEWFSGYAGSLCVPGQTRSTEPFIHAAIRGAKESILRLLDVQFTHGDYSEVVVPPNSLIYCDPPYYDGRPFKENKALGKFYRFDYKAFYEWCHKMAKEGHKVFISEKYMPEGFICIWADYTSNKSMRSLCKSDMAKFEKLYIPAETKLG